MRKIIIPILISLAFLLLIPNIRASSTQQYNKIYLNPFYLETMTKNINYTFNLSISPPDSIAKVVSAILNFQLYVTSSPQTFQLYTNGVKCNNWNWTGLSSGIAIASFDCSNVIIKAGNYSFILSSIKDSGGLTAWLDLTYMNNPVGESLLKGTEYMVGDNVRIFLQLLNSSKLPINNGWCYLTSYYPNNTYLWNNLAMITLGENGLYYFDNTAPNIVGNYMLSADCRYPVSNYSTSSMSFNYGSTADAYINGNPPNIYSQRINVTCPAGSIVNATICYYGNSPAPHDDDVRIFYDTTQIGDIAEANNNWVCANYSTSYINSGLNQFHYFGVGNIGTKNSHYFYYTNNASNTISYYYNGSIWAMESARTYLIRLNMTCVNNVSYNMTEYQETVGAGEMHVSPKISEEEISQFVWNYTNRTLTDYNQSDILNRLSQINSTSYDIVSRLAEINLTTYGISSNLSSMNQSIYSQVSSLQSSISQLTSTVNNINSTALMILGNESEIKTTIISINTTINFIASNLTSIQNQLSAIDSNINSTKSEILNSITNVNASIFSKLYLIQDDLTTITNQLLNISNLIIGTNSSIHSRLDDINMEIISTNTTITNVNASIFWKLYRIQDDLANITDYLILLTNTTFNGTMNMTCDLTSVLNLINSSYSNVTNQIAYTNNTLTNLINTFRSEALTYYNNLYSTINSAKTEILTAITAFKDTLGEMVDALQWVINTLGGSISIGKVYTPTTIENPPSCDIWSRIIGTCRG